MKAIAANTTEDIDHINNMIKQGHVVELIGRNSNGVIVHFKNDKCGFHSWDFHRTKCMVCNAPYTEN